MTTVWRAAIDSETKRFGINHRAGGHEPSDTATLQTVNQQNSS